jgi:hypothetical protein
MSENQPQQPDQLDQPDQPRQWAIVELFGHTKLAGEISEHTIGGCSFVRIDVPAVGSMPRFTKLQGNSSIYGITFVTEEVARAAAAAYRVKPVSEYEIPALRQAALFHEPNNKDEDEEDPFRWP